MSGEKVIGSGKCDARFCPDQRAVGSRTFSDNVREFSPDESADASADASAVAVWHRELQIGWRVAGEFYVPSHDSHVARVFQSPHDRHWNLGDDPVVWHTITPDENTAISRPTRHNSRPTMWRRL